MKDVDGLFIRPGEDSFDFRERYSRIADGYRRYMILRGALETRLFDFMAEPSTAEEISERAGTDQLMTELVCEALTEMGFVEKAGGRFRSTDSSSLYMDSGSELYLGTSFDLIDASLRSWDSFEDAVRDGNTPYREDPDRFYRSMTAFGWFSKGGFIAELMDFIEDDWMLPGMRLLDVAGGHGLYCVAIKSRYPSLEVRYFDRKAGARVAADTFSEYGADVEILAGDYYAGEIPGGNDIVVSSFNDASCKPELVPKLRRALNPKGLAIVRRYVMEVQDPVERVIQANISRPEGSPFWTGRRGQPQEALESYDEAMEDAGMAAVKRERTANGTEMVAYRSKRGSFAPVQAYAKSSAIRAGPYPFRDVRFGRIGSSDGEPQPAGLFKTLITFVLHPSDEDRPHVLQIDGPQHLPIF
ncbi:MAG: hypothetical protein IKM91_00490 [Candidatus Methanomethylophilaceae archaeon]|nr:hypothetical protein [Candidatus Methanomethylophilaceae archaeon]MBR6037441.1 hypothetical protein [Candidatus Methanomethylophilaceae archaeon]MBR6870089.1 hypothetical protein [Candidatus Methanomethylophilaceae archaeon]